jgi:hypothetical protein
MKLHKGYDGRMFHLLNEETAAELKVGDKAVTSRGEKVVLSYIQAPHKSSSSGKVTVKPCGENDRSGQEYYPGVINAEFVEVEESREKRKCSVCDVDYVPQDDVAYMWGWCSRGCHAERTPVIVAMRPNYWGKGDTIEEAIKNCGKDGRKKPRAYFIDPDFDVHPIDGGLSVPKDSTIGCNIISWGSYPSVEKKGKRS